MFFNDVNKKEEIRNIAIQHLRKYGIKYRPKKTKPATQVLKYGKKFFKVPLPNLDTETVTLKNGSQLIVPKRIHEMCSFILSKVQTEGIFRKEGSKSRQNEIKLSLDRGCLLGDEHHVIDVAVVLKSFLRDLPEALIPSSYHELFLRCSLIDKKLEAIYLACLLLPSEHLNVLSYLMQFFNEVASYSEYNKMGFGNLAIVIGPNVFPIDEKIAPKSQPILSKKCDIVKLMIENCRNIGVIPEYIIEQVGHLKEVDMDKDKRRKKRRSGSLTRMFNGLKKIVGSKIDEEVNSNVVTPDLLLTPSIHRSVKKRKAENGISTKKRKELLNKLPERALLSTPFTPCRTPVSINPNGKKVLNFQPHEENISQEGHKEKKLHWYMRSRSMKNLKDESEPSNRRNSLGPRSVLERRWSAVNQATNLKKKIRNSCSGTQLKKFADNRIEEKSAQEPDYVRVSKTEYEEIKNRVSEIERRISMELESVNTKEQSEPEETSNDVVDNNLHNVQTAYEQTLVQALPLSPTTDQLARRLSRDLRIRRHSEQKVIRSPSARKIGSMRRRSREMEKKNVNLVRNQSWHVSTSAIIPRVSLKRKSNVPGSSEDSRNSSKVKVKADTQSSYLPSPNMSNNKTPYCEKNKTELSNPQLSCNTSGSSSEQWISANEFLMNIQTPQNSFGSGRASVAKLRSQNAGMVLAKAKLFDKLTDSDTSDSFNAVNIQTNPVKKVMSSAKNVHKIGSVRTSEARMSYRIRTLRAEDKKLKKSMSPRRRNATVSQRQRLQIAKQYVKINKENCLQDSLTTPSKEICRGNADTPKSSPRKTPHIKKSLVVKSPKRLCRTPVNYNRSTPLKVLVTPRCEL